MSSVSGFTKDRALELDDKSIVGSEIVNDQLIIIRRDGKKINVGDLTSGELGAKGPVGNKGPLGNKGPVGTKGAQGAQGIKGITGDTGPRGDQGLVGEKGPLGDKGPIGNKGALGNLGVGLHVTGTLPNTGALPATGTKGDAYLIGGHYYLWDTPTSQWWDAGDLQGPQGPKGLQGDQGIRGVEGTVGIKGITGDKGPIGNQGLKGFQGDTGIKGLTGDPGDKGLTGDPGDKGPKGDIGDKGLRGDTGPGSPLEQSPMQHILGDLKLRKAAYGNVYKDLSPSPIRMSETTDVSPNVNIGRLIKHPNGLMYSVPIGSYIYVYDPMSKSFYRTNFGVTFPGIKSYDHGVVADDGRIYYFPNGWDTQVLIVDPKTNSARFDNLGFDWTTKVPKSTFVRPDDPYAIYTITVNSDLPYPSGSPTSTSLIRVVINKTTGVLTATEIFKPWSSNTTQFYPYHQTDVIPFGDGVLMFGIDLMTANAQVIYWKTKASCVFKDLGYRAMVSNLFLADDGYVYGVQYTNMGGPMIKILPKEFSIDTLNFTPTFVPDRYSTTACTGMALGTDGFVYTLSPVNSPGVGNRNRLYYFDPKVQGFKQRGTDKPSANVSFSSGVMTDNLGNLIAPITGSAYPDSIFVMETPFDQEPPPYVFRPEFNR